MLVNYQSPENIMASEWTFANSIVVEFYSEQEYVYQYHQWMYNMGYAPYGAQINYISFEPLYYYRNYAQQQSQLLQEYKDVQKMITELQPAKEYTEEQQKRRLRNQKRWARRKEARKLKQALQKVGGEFAIEQPVLCPPSTFQYSSVIDEPKFFLQQPDSQYQQYFEKQGLLLEQWHHINAPGAGLCGFFSLGVALDIQVFGTRCLWMGAAICDITRQPGTAKMSLDLSYVQLKQLASNMFRIIQLLIPGCWGDSTDPIIQLQPEYNWHFLPKLLQLLNSQVRIMYINKHSLITMGAQQPTALMSLMNNHFTVFIQQISIEYEVFRKQAGLDDCHISYNIINLLHFQYSKEIPESIFGISYYEGQLWYQGRKEPSDTTNFIVDKVLQIKISMQEQLIARKEYFEAKIPIIFQQLSILYQKSVNDPFVILKLNKIIKTQPIPNVQPEVKPVIDDVVKLRPQPASVEPTTQKQQIATQQVATVEKATLKQPQNQTISQPLENSVSVVPKPQEVQKATVEKTASKQLKNQKQTLNQQQKNTSSVAKSLATAEATASNQLQQVQPQQQTSNNTTNNSKQTGAIRLSKEQQLKLTDLNKQLSELNKQGIQSDQLLSVEQRFDPSQYTQFMQLQQQIKATKTGIQQEFTLQQLKQQLHNFKYYAYRGLEKSDKRTIVELLSKSHYQQFCAIRQKINEIEQKNPKQQQQKQDVQQQQSQPQVQTTNLEVQQKPKTKKIQKDRAKPEGKAKFYKSTEAERMVLNKIRDQNKQPLKLKLQEFLTQDELQCFKQYKINKTNFQKQEVKSQNQETVTQPNMVAQQVQQLQSKDQVLLPIIQAQMIVQQTQQQQHVQPPVTVVAQQKEISIIQPVTQAEVVTTKPKDCEHEKWLNDMFSEKENSFAEELMTTIKQMQKSIVKPAIVINKQEKKSFYSKYIQPFFNKQQLKPKKVIDLLAGVEEIENVQPKQQQYETDKYVQFEDTRIKRFNYSYVYGKQFINEFEHNQHLQSSWKYGVSSGRKQQEKIEQLYDYCHAGLRTSADFISYSQLLSLKKDNVQYVIVSLGSKWHKDLKILTSIGLNFILVAIRPKELGYDIAYYQKHEKMSAPHIHIEQAVNRSNAEWIYHTIKNINKQAQIVIYANDCLWYEGVFDFIKYSLNQQAKVLVSNGTYTKIIGKHYYYDGEGEFEIYKQDKRYYITNKPRYNDVIGGYQHPMMDQPILPGHHQIEDVLFIQNFHINTGTASAQCGWSCVKMNTTIPNREVRGITSDVLKGCEQVEVTQYKRFLKDDAFKIQDLLNPTTFILMLLLYISTYSQSLFFIGTVIVKVIEYSFYYSYTSDTVELLQNNKKVKVKGRYLQEKEFWKYFKHPNLIYIAQNITEKVIINWDIYEQILHIASGTRLNDSMLNRLYIGIKKRLLGLNINLKDQSHQLIIDTIKYYESDLQRLNVKLEPFVDKQTSSLESSLSITNYGYIVSIMLYVACIGYSLYESNFMLDAVVLLNIIVILFTIGLVLVQQIVVPAYKMYFSYVQIFLCTINAISTTSQVRSSIIEWWAGGDHPVHISKESYKKLVLRNNSSYVKDLEFYGLGIDCNKKMSWSFEDKSQTQLECQAAEMYDYYTQFCTCDNMKFLQYDDFVHDPIDQQQDKMYCFGICAINNISSLLARHLGTSVRPDPKVLEEYKEVIQPLMQVVGKDLYEISRQNYYDMTDHIQQLVPSKKKQIILGQIMSHEMSSKVIHKAKWTTLVCFTKVGEWQHQAKEEYSYSARPRQIWSPTPILKAYPGWINKIYLSSLKQYSKSFICGFGQNALGEYLTEQRYDMFIRHKGNVKTLVFDGSSHDAHQWQEFIDIVDNNVLKFSTTIVHDYGLSENIQDIVKIALHNQWFKAESSVTWQGDKYRIYSFKIKGTTFSGHPTRTTLGNSLRTLSYCLFLYYKARPQATQIDLMNIFKGIHKDIVINVAGDDVMINGESQVILDMHKQLLLLYAKDNEQGIFGLGQVVKDPQIKEWDYIDFLSRDGYMSDVIRMTRKVDRVILHSKLTTQANQLLRQQSSARQKKQINRFKGVLNYGFVSQLSQWSKGISIFESLVNRRRHKATKPITKQEYKLYQKIIQYSMIDAQYDHQFENTYYYMLFEKYGYNEQTIIDVINNQMILN